MLILRLGREKSASRFLCFIEIKLVYMLKRCVRARIYYWTIIISGLAPHMFNRTRGMRHKFNKKMASPTPKKATEGSKRSKAQPSEGENAGKTEEQVAAVEGRQVARWEKQWVAIQNVIEFGPEIWVKKWVLVHDSGEARKRSDSHSQYSEFSAHESAEERNAKKTKKDGNKKHVCQFPGCGKIFFDSSTKAARGMSRFTEEAHGDAWGEDGIVR